MCRRRGPGEISISRKEYKFGTLTEFRSFEENKRTNALIWVKWPAGVCRDMYPPIASCRRISGGSEVNTGLSARPDNSFV